VYLVVFEICTYYEFATCLAAVFCAVGFFLDMSIDVVLFIGFKM
jgi:hypothetical protein